MIHSSEFSFSYSCFSSIMHGIYPLASDLHILGINSTSTMRLLRGWFAQSTDGLDLQSIHEHRGAESSTQVCLEKFHSAKGVRSFGWLLVQNRIQSRDNLKKKTIMEDVCCELCGEREETLDHIVSGCPLTASFWSHVGVATDHIAPVSELWNSRLPDSVAPATATTFLLLCCWCSLPGEAA